MKNFCTNKKITFKNRIKPDSSPRVHGDYSRSALVKVIKSLTLEEKPRKGKRGNKLIRLKNKSLFITDDAIVMKKDLGMDNDAYTDACIVIHGPGGEKTEHPVVLLYNGDLNDAQQQLISLLPMYAQSEFPDIRDAYAVTIMTSGQLTDDRVVWNTI